MPDADDVASMMVFNSALIEAGALLAGDGFRPTSKAARVTSTNDELRTSFGPIAADRGRIGGYWSIQAGSLDEAIGWAKRMPLGPGDEIEVRQMFDPADFSPEAREIAGI